METTTRHFGFGNCVVDTGTFGGLPAVFISHAANPGKPGESAKREDIPTDELMDGDIVLTFPTDEQAKAVSDALVCGE